SSTHILSPCPFFFIFYPPSPTATSTLSLHDALPIFLGHEGIPGHFLQLSIANHLRDEIRRQHSDNVFVEGWALYGEEMLSRQGLDRKSTRLNSSHLGISYAVFCLKKKTKNISFFPPD